ncbi:hypothetical protein LIER_41357 [Lithospermum erythrorhizon]|uniref:Uncharacterized protein n=1 Tax=Lithospermum erythrorhizon TaxID=34254 RepID=A0AAV3R8B6_LITER
MEYYDTEVLKDVGSHLGTLLRINTKTTNNERGRFARPWNPSPPLSSLEHMHRNFKAAARKTNRKGTVDGIQILGIIRKDLGNPLTGQHSSNEDLHQDC